MNSKEIRKLKSQYAGGMLLTPVQTLVATFIPGTAGNADESPADHQKTAANLSQIHFI